jgi:hypothetical protein
MRPPDSVPRPLPAPDHCATCRWLQEYRCPHIKTHCRFGCPEFAYQGRDCRKYQERSDG